MIEYIVIDQADNAITVEAEEEPKVFGGTLVKPEAKNYEEWLLKTT